MSTRPAVPKGARTAAPGRPKQGETPSGGSAVREATSVGAPLSIGQAARQSGVSAKMVRHYESLGLLPPVARTDSGYRQYSQAEVRTLQFIKRARVLGFSMAEIAELVSLWNDRERASASVKHIAQKHIDDLTQRIEALQAMQRTLTTLVQHCHGDGRPNCPILDDLAGASDQP